MAFSFPWMRAGTNSCRIRVSASAREFDDPFSPDVAGLSPSTRRPPRGLLVFSSRDRGAAGTILSAGAMGREWGLLFFAPVAPWREKPGLGGCTRRHSKTHLSKSSLDVSRNIPACGTRRIEVRRSQPSAPVRWLGRPPRANFLEALTSPPHPVIACDPSGMRSWGTPLAPRDPPPTGRATRSGDSGAKPLRRGFPCSALAGQAFGSCPLHIGRTGHPRIPNVGEAASRPVRRESPLGECPRCEVELGRHADLDAPIPRSVPPDRFHTNAMRCAVRPARAFVSRRAARLRRGRARVAAAPASKGEPSLPSRRGASSIIGTRRKP